MALFVLLALEMEAPLNDDQLNTLEYPIIIQKIARLFIPKNHSSLFQHRQNFIHINPKVLVKCRRCTDFVSPHPLQLRGTLPLTFNLFYLGVRTSSKFIFLGFHVFANKSE